MARDTIWTDLTGRKEGRIIATGPANCAWAFFFLYHIPLLTKLRQDNPDAIIVTGGFFSDWWYAQDLCDYYVGYPIDNKVATLTGRPAGAVSPTTSDVVELVKQKLGRAPDEVISLDGSHRDVGRIYAQHFDVMVKRPPLKHNPDSNRIAIWGRYKPGCERTIYNCVPEHWDRTIDYLISKGYDVSVMGAKGGSYESKRPDVISLLNEPEEWRAKVTFDHLEECLCSLSDLNASGIVCLFLGHPTCFFNAQYREMGIIPVRNPFKTIVHFGNPWEWPDWRGPNPAHTAKYDEYKDVWENAIDEIIKRSRTEKHCELDEVNMSYMSKYLQ